MAYLQGSYPLRSCEQLTAQGFSFVIHCPEIAAQAEPGQFVHLRIPGFSLRRPISICEIDRASGTIRLVFEVRGEGTGVFAGYRAGDMVDLLGPLGHGFTLLPLTRKVILVGGGIGTPPMLELAKHYGKNATAILGFRDASCVLLLDDFLRTGAQVILCTDNGSAGRRGFVTEPLYECIENADLVCACGPGGMLKGIIRAAEEANVPCEVSLEERMGCGVGACLVCACKSVKNGKEFYAHVCKDGPVFDAKEVVL